MLNNKIYKIFLTKFQILAIAELVNEELSENILKQAEKQERDDLTYKQQYYLFNKEKIRKQQKKYRIANYEKISEYNKKWREKNKERLKEYYKENKEKILKREKMRRMGV